MLPRRVAGDLADLELVEIELIGERDEHRLERPAIDAALRIRDILGEARRKLPLRDVVVGHALAVRIVDIVDLGMRADAPADDLARRSEEHTSELQSLMRISYAVFCLQKKNTSH